MFLSILLQSYGRYDDQGASGGGDFLGGLFGLVLLALGFILVVVVALVLFVALARILESISEAFRGPREMTWDEQMKEIEEINERSRKSANARLGRKDADIDGRNRSSHPYIVPKGQENQASKDE